MKETYCKIIVALIGVIILMAIVVISMPPKLEIKEIEKKVVVEVEKDPTYKYNISPVERETLARLVYLEANTESIECQRAVASVVINRWQDGMWGNTITSVIYYPYQFSPSGLIHKTTPTETNYAAVDQVLKNGPSLPSHVMYFRSGHGFSKTWDGYAESAQIGDVYFGYFLADKGEQ